MAKVASPPRVSAEAAGRSALKSLAGPRTPKRSASKAAVARALLGKSGAKSASKSKFSSPSSSSSRAIESPDRRAVKKSSKRQFGTPQRARASGAGAAAASSSSLKSLVASGKKAKAAFSVSAAAASAASAAAGGGASSAVAEDGVIELDSVLREQLRKRMKIVYSVVNTFHEPIPPVGCDDYAITGNVTPGSYLQYMDLLCAEDSPVPREYRCVAAFSFNLSFPPLPFPLPLSSCCSCSRLTTSLFHSFPFDHPGSVPTRRSSTLAPAWGGRRCASRRSRSVPRLASSCRSGLVLALFFSSFLSFSFLFLSFLFFSFLFLSFLFSLSLPRNLSN